MNFEKVKSVLANQFDLDPDNITMETSLIDDIGADSLDIVELMQTLEYDYDIAISDEDAAKLHTVGRICEYLDRLN